MLIEPTLALCGHTVSVFQMPGLQVFIIIFIIITGILSPHLSSFFFSEDEKYFHAVENKLNA